MNVRVNLLRPAEQRYQGPVSARFAITVTGITAGVIALLALLWGVHGILSVRSGLAGCRADWQRLEPRFKEITAQEEKDAAAKALLAELDKWGAARPPWEDLLRELQAIAPPSVQFLRLNVRSEWSALRPPPIVTSEGKEIPQPAMPARKFFISIEGRAGGELADEVVVGFERTIRNTSGYAARFESVKLQRLVRDVAQPGDRQPDRLFLIEGEFSPRKLE